MDVIVVGAGIAGLSTARTLNRRGHRRVGKGGGLCRTHIARTLALSIGANQTPEELPEYMGD